MKLTKVTLTGADDSIKPERLFELSEKYPFVEWGILLSRNSKGSKRFPSARWLMELEALNSTWYESEPQWSGHLCGSYVREILMGNMKFVSEIGQAWDIFQRVQINTHGSPHEYDAQEMFEAMKATDKEFIFQYDNENTVILMDAVENDVNCSTLFDLSHGAGVLPSNWPQPLTNIKCGYAGGLSPENVEDQIKKLNETIDNVEIWIDMETHLRSDNDKLFDLYKCEKVLSICQNYFS